MTEISCQVCMDLMPLVMDGAASAESRAAVEAHVARCPACAALYGSQPPQPDARQALGRLLRRARLFCALLMMFGICFGLGLTASSDMFYNALIMPAVGALGYVIFRWRALYALPCLLLAAHGLAALLRLLPAGEVLWTVVYSPFALAGVLLAWLLQLLFAKTSGPAPRARLYKAAALAGALVLAGGLALFANGLLGNPVSAWLARRTAQSHVQQHYAAAGYQLGEVNYSFKDGRYHAQAAVPGSQDLHFGFTLDLAGRLVYDDYDSYVPSGFNTASRLDSAYRQLADTVLQSPAFPFACSIAYGSLEFWPQSALGQPDTPPYALAQEDLAPDGLYDIPQLGAQAGRLVLYAESETANARQAAQMLLEVKALMEQGGVPFCAVDLVLKSAGAENGGRFEVQNFLSADIVPQGLEQRLQAAHEQTLADYARMDAEKAAVPNT